MNRFANDGAHAGQPCRRRSPILTLLISVILLVGLAACGNPASPTPVIMPTPPEVAPDTIPEIDESETTEEEINEADTDIAASDDADSAPSGQTEPSAEPAEETAAIPQTSALPAFDPAVHSLQLETVASGFTQPLYVDHAADGRDRIFIVQKTGAIHIVQDGNILPTPFLDISDRVRSSGFEQGLLGLAFHPNFSDSGYFWLNYTDLQGDTVVSRFQVSVNDPNLADADSEFITLQIPQPAANHNGGGLKFGPDGNLWIGTGDGGGAGDRFEQGQDPTTLLGKMLRLDVTSDPNTPYIIPTDNPWLNVDWNGQDVADEIWAVGLRNPWRYSFDRATGDLWIADVGQSAIEAVHLTPANHSGGINYGWPILEGTRCFRNPNNCDPTGLDLPVIEYAHGQGDCSITGGYIYRGAQFEALQGAYIFGDYCSGNIWVAVPDEAGNWTDHHVLSTSIQISSFGEDEAGELYLTGLSDGNLYRVILE